MAPWNETYQMMVHDEQDRSEELFTSMLTANNTFDKSFLVGLDSQMMNNPSDSTDEPLISEHASNVILVFVYSLIVIVSLFGNIFVCRVMLTSARTTTNMLIVNLAISDLLLTTFNIPVNIVRFVVSSWPFGSFICTVTPFIQSLSAHCSSITMMVIAFERYQL